MVLSRGDLALSRYANPGILDAISSKVKVQAKGQGSVVWVSKTEIDQA
jgi:hypothetical protein